MGRRLATTLAAGVAAGAVLFAVQTVRSLNPPRVPGLGRAPWLPGEPGPGEQIGEGVRQSTASYRSKDKEIRIERYLPSAKGRYPAVLLLHGGGAGFRGDVSGLRATARDFARRGYVALLPHYFEQTDTLVSDVPTVNREFVRRMGAISRGVDYARGLPEVDPERVGLIGWSLGASLALEVAAEDRHVAADVGIVGGMIPEAVDKMTRMPPTLLLAGEKDNIFPGEEARGLDRRLRMKGMVVESKVYPGQGHGFTGAAAADATRRTNEFFDKYLARRPPRSP
jgi:carboxymethylenebutenolidase